MKMKNSAIENFEKALAELCRSARKEKELLWHSN